MRFGFARYIGFLVSHFRSLFHCAVYCVADLRYVWYRRFSGVTSFSSDLRVLSTFRFFNYFLFDSATAALQLVYCIPVNAFATWPGIVAGTRVTHRCHVFSAVNARSSLELACCSQALPLRPSQRSRCCKPSSMCFGQCFGSTCGLWFSVLGALLTAAKSLFSTTVFQLKSYALQLQRSAISKLVVCPLRILPVAAKTK